MKLASVVVAFVLLLPATATAGIFDIFGFGSRNIAMGGAASTTSDDYTASFYNPGALTQRKKIHLGATFSAFVPALQLDHQSNDARHEPGDLSTLSGISFGVLFPLGGKINNRVALAIGIYLPIAHALELQSLEPDVPRWYRYNTLGDKLHVVAAVAYEIVDGISIGAGIQALADLDGEVSLQIDLANESIDRRDANIQLITTASPVVGLFFEFLDGWRIGATWRGENEVRFSVPLLFDFGDTADLVVTVEGTELYTPHTLVLGTSCLIEAANLQLALDGVLALWSLAPDPSLEVRVQGQGELIEGLGVEDYLNLVPGQVPSAGFNDSVEVRFGVEQAPLDWLRLRAGYFFRSAAVGEQSGSTSYVDSSAHAVSLGGAITFPDPLEINNNPFIFDIAGQVIIHPDRSVQKDDPGNPIGSLDFGGEVWGIATSLRHDF